jgi:RNA polymerase sigma-70 factor, ECF subfamily
VAAAGLAILDALDDPRLDRYLPLHAARAELLRRIGDAAAADAAYATAIALAHTDAERAALERRRDSG